MTAQAQPVDTTAKRESVAVAVSVIVPVYNIESCLADCLDSLAAQTFDDFEVVIVDDGSTDGSPAVIERYVAEHPQIFRSLRKPNGGLGDARNHGMERARGKFLAFIDGDDAVSPGMLALLYRRASETGADLVACGIRNFTGSPDDVGTFYPEPDPTVFGHSLAEEPRLLYRLDASACNKLYERDLFDRADVRFPVGVAFEDLPTVYRLLAHARRVEKVDEPLYLYRRERKESITAAYGERYLDLVDGLRVVGDYYEVGGLLARYREPLLRLHLTHLIAGRYPDFFAGAPAGARWRFIREAFRLLDDRFAGWRTSDVCTDLWPHMMLRVVSTRPLVLRVFCALPRKVYFGALARMGAFDPMR